MKQPRAVFDVAVFLEAALCPESEAGDLLRRFVERRDFELVVSPSILDHVERAFGDSEIRNVLPSPQESRRWAAALGVLTTVVDTGGEESGGVAESGDQLYLEAILKAGGGLVVSSDPSLLAVTDVDGVEVLTPGALIEILEASRRVSPRLRAPLSKDSR